ncbi:hypothetical protein NMY22_g5402 [Coprinellus aureogranulatus]|nr:hypothetical protein NMY22_g5402 [Coprinellus aureogranulatus]
MPPVEAGIPVGGSGKEEQDLMWIGAACATSIIYHHSLTLADEVTHVWLNRRFGIATLAFFMNRYGVAAVVLSNCFSAGQLPEDHNLDGICCVQFDCLLVLRVQAAYQNISTWIPRMTGALYIGSSGGSACLLGNLSGRPDKGFLCRRPLVELLCKKTVVRILWNLDVLPYSRVLVIRINSAALRIAQAAVARFITLGAPRSPFGSGFDIIFYLVSSDQQPTLHSSEERCSILLAERPVFL